MTPTPENAQSGEVEEVERQFDILERLYSEVFEACKKWNSGCKDKVREFKTEVENYARMVDKYIDKYCIGNFTTDCRMLKENKTMFEDVAKVVEQYAVAVRVASEYDRSCVHDAFECAVKARLLEGELQRLSKLAGKYIEKYCAEPDDEAAEHCLQMKELKARSDILLIEARRVVNMYRMGLLQRRSDSNTR